MEHTVTLLMSEHVTHDVKRFVVTRPDGFDFEPGQGVELAIDREGWRGEGRPFTPTSLPDDGVVEFIIKGYPEHRGVTEQLHHLEPGASLQMSDPFGAIRYRGPGTFIAAGAGITPFLSIIRQLRHDGDLDGHRLLFANKGPDDIIEAAQLSHYLGKENCHFLCSRGGDCNCESGRIDQAYLSERINDFAQRFYVCGPPKFTEAVTQALAELGAESDSVVFEQ